MKQFSTFRFHSTSFDPQTLIATFTYQFDDQFFTETVNFSPSVKKSWSPHPQLKGTNLDETTIHNLLRHIHIAIGISYYKLSPTAEILVPDRRTFEMLDFRKTFYLNGLGEFMVVNGLSPSEVARFVFPSRWAVKKKNMQNTLNSLPRTSWKTQNDKVLLFFGGWKDSLLSVQLLQQRHQPFTLRSMGENPLHALAASKVDAPRILHTRTLDPKLLTMNQSGERYNGHVPITGILSFISLLTAYLYDFNTIVLSNEKSANHGNLTLDGIEINHQRSKSEAFEKAFQTYLHHHISSEGFNLTYYSILRPRYEIRIVQEFCKYPQYFHSFSSCNRNFHLWGSTLSSDQLRCGKCPKCAFVFTMMRAFLPARQVEEIFGKNLFADERLLPLFHELLGIAGCKPFECVGTNDEMVLALHLASKRGFQAGEKAIAALQTRMQSELGEVALQKLQSDLLS